MGIACLCFLELPVLLTARKESPDDLVELQLNLPPDVQKMLEDMCEMEGITTSEMLTRWIDARWEAMGYTDADLEAYEASQASCAADGSCGTSVGLNKENVKPIVPSGTTNTPRVEKASEPAKAANSRVLDAAR